MLKRVSGGSQDVTQYDAGLNTSLVVNGNVSCLATRVLLYSLHGNQEGEKLLVYQGESTNTTHPQPVFGIVDFCGNTIFTEF